ncbi:hypothetical protein Cgig2_005222 [Carnegiea gigantea]|uniref:Uncharacterized protein n=1 Tax=Carnegiea gigantea TaxID=171969 RepID=A0A9Q1QCA0_9CARY|nr:hypothetical protein Cgig2_005222 [Carnegiea gigantea]
MGSEHHSRYLEEFHDHYDRYLTTVSGQAGEENHRSHELHEAFAGAPLGLRLVNNLLLNIEAVRQEWMPNRSSGPEEPSHRMSPILDAQPGLRSRSRPRSLGGGSQERANPRVRHGFRLHNGCTTTECRELKKALYELANRGQIDRFLKRGQGAFRKGPIQSHKELREKECSNEVVAPIAGGYIEGTNAWNPAGYDNQVREPLDYSPHIIRQSGGRSFSFPPANSMLVELKVANTLAHRILIDTFRLADIITWDCLKKLKHLKRDITTLVHSVMGFVRTICLPLWFGDKAKLRNFEVDFMVVDIPTIYSVILGRTTLHKVKSVIDLHLLQIHYEALVICVIASVDPECQHPETAYDIKIVSFKEERPDRIGRVGREMAEQTRYPPAGGAALAFLSPIPPSLSPVSLSATCI